MQGEHDNYFQKSGGLPYAVDGFPLSHKVELRQGDAFQFKVKNFLTVEAVGKRVGPARGRASCPCSEFQQLKFRMFI